jgi:hypothetical protein
MSSVKGYSCAMIHASPSWPTLSTLAAQLTLRESIGLALVGGVVSLLLAAVSGLIAYLTARANFGRELERIKAQIAAQREAEQQEKIVELKQQYLAPLRYYAQVLSHRFGELKVKFYSEENIRVRNWFKQIKDHVANDKRTDHYGVWCCYEGVFSVSTVYYTFCYFQCARELRAHAPFREIRPLYSEQLERQLWSVGQVFSWNNGENGIWDTLQEVIGEAFTMEGARMSYAAMCREQDTGDAFRRAPYLRPLDFYWTQVTSDKAGEIQNSLEGLVQFLDSQDPQASTKLISVVGKNREVD